MNRTVINIATVAIVSVSLTIWAEEPKERITSFDTVEAKKFVVKDGQGNVRAKIEVDDRNIASLTLGDQSSVVKLIACVQPDGTSVFRIFDSRGFCAINIVAAGPEDTIRVELGPQAQVMLHDYHYGLGAIAGMASNNVPYLELPYSQGRAKVAIDLPPDIGRGASNALPHLEIFRPPQRTDLGK